MGNILQMCYDHRPQHSALTIQFFGVIHYTEPFTLHTHALVHSPIISKIEMTLGTKKISFTPSMGKFSP